MFSKIKIEANGEDEEEPVRLQDQLSADRQQADIIYENMEKASNNADEQTKLINFFLSWKDSAFTIFKTKISLLQQAKVSL